MTTGAGYGMRQGLMKILWLRALILLASSTACSHALENWPEFRGPERNGHSVARKLPLAWSETNNVAWKTAIHDLGWSSPVVWGDQIWITTAHGGWQTVSLRFAWTAERAESFVMSRCSIRRHPEHVASMNSYASPTPAIEAGRVYVHYGTYGTACLDTRDGRILWSRRDLTCDHHEGPGSSVMLHNNLLCFNVDGRDVQYVIALDKRTGKTVWKTNRSIDYTPFATNLRKAFCTPIILEAGGRLPALQPGSQSDDCLRSAIRRRTLEGPV